MNIPIDTLLGRTVDHQPAYSPSILQPIARADKRAQLGIGDVLPFVGSDRWTAYELSWLTPSGKPAVAVLRCVLPCDSAFLVESKSLKLYLNSFARAVHADAAAVGARIVTDLTAVVGAAVTVDVIESSAWDDLEFEPIKGLSLDDIELDQVDLSRVQPDYLRSSDGDEVDEVLLSQLFKSNCPVTGQPDWATISIGYVGQTIDREGLLRYLLSYREAREFHEQCVERIFLDISARCHPSYLAVEGRFTRRGGIDINPYRASSGQTVVPDRRQWRQ